MSVQLHNFNANDHGEMGFSPIPPGTYTIACISSKLVPNKKRTGQIIEMEMIVLEGPQSGRKYIERINISNPNSTAVDIAMRTLSAIGRAVGKITPATTGELHNIPFMVDLEVEKSTKDGKEMLNNSAKKYYARKQVAPQQASPPQQAPAPQQAVAPQQAPAEAPTYSEPIVENPQQNSQALAELDASAPWSGQQQ